MDSQCEISNKLDQIKAGDLMSRFGITISQEDFLLNAAHLMMRFRISGLPVVCEGGKIVGIITATDLFNVMGKRLVANEPAFSSVDCSGRIKDIMTKDVVTVHKDTSLREIINIMFTRNLHTLPVVQDDQLIGIIGRRDAIYSYYNLFNF